MVTGGQEVIVGIKRDPSFGPVVMFGLGGIFVEVFQDVSFRVAPLAEEEAREMMEEVRSYPLLAGSRGSAARDVEAVREVLLRAGQLALDCPQIKELDINPLLVLEQGCYVADARIML